MKSANFISKQVESGEYYFLNLSPRKGSEGTVVCGGREHCARDYRVCRRHFPYHSLEYVISGEGTLTMNGKTFPLHPGALFTYGPTTSHTMVSNPAKPLFKHFIDFVGPRFTRLLANHPLSKRRPVYFPSTANMAYLFDNLLRQGRSSQPNKPAICACLLELLILQSANLALTLADAESPSHLRFQQIRDMIVQKHLSLMGLQDIAASAHTDAAYICRLFRRYSRESPCEMLTRMKMQHAADLLNGSTALVKDAALTVGYSDPYHFSRVFRHYYGYSPRQFIMKVRTVTRQSFPAEPGK